MKLRSIAIIAACAALAASSLASGLKSAAKSVNNKVCASFLKNDGLKTFEKLTRNSVTSDFKHTENGSSLTYDQMLAQMRGSMGGMRITSSRTTLSHIKDNGMTGSADAKHDMRATMAGPDKKRHRFHMWGSTIETFRKEDGKWKLAEMAWTSSKMTMDGKPFDPSKAPG